MQKKLFFYLLLSTIYLLLILPSPALAATMTLSPNKVVVNRTCSFSVNINLDTAGVETDGSDAILLYDPTKLSATSISNGSIYADFPGNNIDEKLGKVSIYALAPTDKGFAGKGVLATVDFRVLDLAPTGLASVNFDYDINDKAKTTDSNVIARGALNDVLTSVISGSYTIGAGECDGALAEASASGIGGGNLEDLPASGTAEVTLLISGIGMLLVITGVLGLKRYK